MSKPFTDFETEFNDLDADFNAFRARVRALLRQIEYDDGDKCGKTPDAPCPVCRHTRVSRGHNEDCALAALLKECEA